MLQYNINWCHLFVEFLEPRYTVFGIDKHPVQQPKNEQVLFKSTFTNSTDRAQEYTFRTERSTRSTATISIGLYIPFLILVSLIGQNEMNLKFKNLRFKNYNLKLQ